MFDAVFKKLLVGLSLGCLLMMKPAHCRQGSVESVIIDAKVSCPSMYKVVFSVPSEIQCVHRCLTKETCSDINYNEDLKQGDNCEIYGMLVEERSKCYTVSVGKGWKFMSFKKMKDKKSNSDIVDESKDPALGFQNRTIKDYQLSSSVEFDEYRRAYQARLNNHVSWCAVAHGLNQFVRVDFEIRKSISAVVLQGDPTYDNWVTSYKINFTFDGYIWKTYQENGRDKIFVGPTTRNTPVKQELVPRIRAFGLLINPQTFVTHQCLRIELYGQDDPDQPVKPQGCLNNVHPLGMASMLIPNNRINASSVFSTSHEAHFARLNRFSCWADRAFQNNLNEYLQVDFGEVKLLFAIATQGQFDFDNWVTSYEVLHSQNGTAFQRILQDVGLPLRFPGNRDRNSIVKNKLQPPIVARYIRINPKGLGPNSDDYALRCEFYGCHPS